MRPCGAAMTRDYRKNTNSDTEWQTHTRAHASTHMQMRRQNQQRYRRTHLAFGVTKFGFNLFRKYVKGQHGPERQKRHFGEMMHPFPIYPRRVKVVYYQIEMSVCLFIKFKETFLIEKYTYPYQRSRLAFVAHWNYDHDNCFDSEKKTN